VKWAKEAGTKARVERATVVKSMEEADERDLFGG
jgi:hypothetical protein